MKRKRSTCEPLLESKCCAFDGCQSLSVSVHGQNPYCREHTHQLCCMSNSKNIFNEVRCNSTVSMISVDGKMYCNSHYRTLIETCGHSECNTSRSNKDLCYDKKWYCDKHKLDTQPFITKMLNVFQKLNEDIVNKICKIHFKNNTYKI